MRETFTGAFLPQHPTVVFTISQFILSRTAFISLIMHSAEQPGSMPTLSLFSNDGSLSMFLCRNAMMCSVFGDTGWSSSLHPAQRVTMVLPSEESHMAIFLSLFSCSGISRNCMGWRQHASFGRR